MLTWAPILVLQSDVLVWWTNKGAWGRQEHTLDAHLFIIWHDQQKARCSYTLEIKLITDIIVAYVHIHVSCLHVETPLEGRWCHCCVTPLNRQSREDWDFLNAKEHLIWQPEVPVCISSLCFPLHLWAEFPQELIKTSQISYIASQTKISYLSGYSCWLYMWAGIQELNGSYISLLPLCHTAISEHMDVQCGFWFSCTPIWQWETYPRFLPNFIPTISQCLPLLGISMGHLCRHMKLGTPELPTCELLYCIT